MKKLAAALALSAALFCTAGAANVGTIDNEYPGDTEAQAQMLCDLGLFRGTDQGFELEKPMTRAEAAVMLTRLLGAEDEALAGTPTHPFYDVPAWANPYVGWLYENGLTKGVSATQYGARQNVTCGQYETFLARALDDWADYSEVMDADELAACNAAGFVRGDAVSLSARALSSGVAKAEINNFSLAQLLIDRNLFTVEQFREAAWDVLPRRYENTVSRANIWDGERRLSCVIASVCVQRNEACTVEPIYDGISLNRIYGALDENDGRSLWLIDPQTLAVTRLAQAETGTWRSLCKSGAVDYLALDQMDLTERVFAIKGNTVREVAKTTHAVEFFEGEWNGVTACTGERYIFPCEGGVCTIDPDGARVISLPEEEEPAGIWPLLFVTQRISAEQTVLTAWTRNGKKINRCSVENDYLAPDVQERVDNAPRILSTRDGYLFGSAGLYRADGERLEQLTSRAVYDFFEEEKSLLLLTHDKGKRVVYNWGMILYPAGDDVVRLCTDGTEEHLLPVLPDRSLVLIRLLGVNDGQISITGNIPTDDILNEQETFLYVLEDRRITVRDFIGNKNAIAEEQQRLDALGVGVGAA